MANTLTYIGGVPVLVNKDTASPPNLTTPTESYILNGSGLYVPIYSQTSVTMQNAAMGTAQGISLNTYGYSSATVQITGTFVATISFQVSIDGNAWWAILGRNTQDGTIVSNATSTGVWVFDVAGFQYLRADITSYTSGSITATGISSIHDTTAKSMLFTGKLAQGVLLVDHSGTIATANTSQQIINQNSSRSYLFVQNTSSNGDVMWINFGSAATESQPSIKLTAGSAYAMEYNVISTDAVYIIGPTVGDAYTAKEG